MTRIVRPPSLQSWGDKAPIEGDNAPVRGDKGPMEDSFGSGGLRVTSRPGVRVILLGLRVYFLSPVRVLSVARPFVIYMRVETSIVK